MLKLTELDHLPGGILERPASALYQQLDGPTLIHLVGRNKRPLFVSVLQHGNEVTGWEAIRRLLKSHYQHDELPRSLLIFIGNVQAARHRLRRLDEQLDFNRCWPGGKPVDPEYSDLFRKIHDRILNTKPIAGIDIHNNTGRNPHYSIVNTQDPRHLAMARKFGKTVVYATYPDTSCSVAFSVLCPSVTLEAGVVGDASGVDHVSNYLIACMEEDVWLGDAVGDIDIYHTVAVVRVKDSCSVGMLGEGADLELPPDVDILNFSMLEPGTRLGYTRNDCADCVTVHTGDASLERSDLLNVENGELRTMRPVMPAMLTTDCDIIRMDCLCYLMERLT